MNVSVIIPAHNEGENIGRVIRDVYETQPKAEIIVVDDGSIDDTALEIKKYRGVILISLPSQCGQSVATYKGLLRATGDVCVIMDGDGQSDPLDIRRMIDELGRADAVFGKRDKTEESFSRRVASLIAYYARRIVLGDYIQDSCGPKVIQKRHIQYLVPFDGMHRFISSMLIHAGLTVVEIPVSHRKRLFGISHYSIAGRALKGLYDIVGLRWILSRNIQSFDDR